MKQRVVFAIGVVGAVGFTLLLLAMLSESRTANAQVWTGTRGVGVSVVPRPYVDGEGTALGPVLLRDYRQDFDGPCLKVEAADFTVELVTDGAVNRAICDGGIQLFTFRVDGAQASPFISLGGTLDIDNDGIADEGVEIVAADLAASTQGWVEVGTSVAKYVRMSVTITSVSGTDNAYFGWRLQGAFVDNLVLATVDTYGVYFINNNAGNIVIQTGADGTDATDEEDQVADWVDAATHTLEVRVSTAGVFTFYIDGAASTITNATGAADAGDILVPVIGMLNDTDADTEMLINWLIVGEVQ